MLKFLKNILILIILLGILAPSINYAAEVPFGGDAAGLAPLITGETSATAINIAKTGEAAVALSLADAQLSVLVSKCVVEGAVVAGSGAGEVVQAGILGTANINTICAMLGIPFAIILNQITLDTATVAGHSLANEIRAKGNLWKQILEFAKKIAGQIFKKVILDRLADALISFISGQKDTIIEDWDEFFQQAGEDAVGLVAQQINVAGVNLCNNFNLNLRFLLLPIPKFSQRVSCSLNQIVGNIDSFLNNFENGSWIAYQEQWYPQNNFYGAAITVLDEVAIKGARAKDAAQSEALAGGGFFSKKVCDPPGTNLNCRIVTPGSWVESQVNELIGPKKDFLSIIGADDVAVYLGAIVNAGINRLSIMSIDGLRGSLKKGDKGLTTTTPTAPCAGLTGSDFQACAQFQSISSASYRSSQYSVQTELNLSLRPRQQAASILSQLITSQTELVSSLDSLAACKPGDAGIISQLSEEQLVLDGLQDRFEDNQTFLAPLEQSPDAVNNVGIDDWLSLGNQAANLQLLADPNSEANLLISLQQDQQEINANISSKLPGIKQQLQSCPKLTPVQPTS